MLRIVFGLGTRAVDRVGTDYPRIIALTEPSLRAQVSSEEILKYSQHNLDLINLKSNQFETARISSILKSNPVDKSELAISLYEEGHLKVPIGRILPKDDLRICVTFDKLVKSTSFADQISWVLSTLEKTYGCPVDIEFSCDGDHFYLLQCRPLSRQLEWEAVDIPTDIPRRDQVFSASHDVQNGKIENIDYVVYISAEGYHSIDNFDDKIRVARAVGAINAELADKTFILIGPGRWGSNDINLGVKVSYNEISNTKALVEVAHGGNGYTPELSFGTHFFQDLIESGIYYLPLYPDEDQSIFNREFFDRQENQLAKIAPNFKDLAKIVKVFDIQKSRGKKTFHLLMDGENAQALAFFR